MPVPTERIMAGLVLENVGNDHEAVARVLRAAFPQWTQESVRKFIGDVPSFAVGPPVDANVLMDALQDAGAVGIVVSWHENDSILALCEGCGKDEFLFVVDSDDDAPALVLQCQACEYRCSYAARDLNTARSAVLLEELWRLAGVEQAVLADLEDDE